MAWNDRIREAAYTSPSGTRFVFDYENVSSTINKKTTGFEFPDVDGTYVQDLGHSGRRYPLRMIFWGDDYDLEAKAFEDALLEKGVGFLEHPIYEPINAVPFGSITRRDDLKTAANQAILEVTFWETTGLVYPTLQVDPASLVAQSIEEYNVATAEQFDDLTDLDSAVEIATFREQFKVFLDGTKSNLKDIAETQEDVNDQFNAISDSISSNLETFIGGPLTTAFQTTLMIQAPARAIARIGARLEAYGNLVKALIGGEPAEFGNDSKNLNEFLTRDLYASTYVTGSIISVINNEFETKPEAITAAEEILSQFDEVVAWRDINFRSLSDTSPATVEVIDTGESYQKLQEAVAITAGFLVDISFSLKQESRIILDRPRSIIELTAELYGVVDEKLDFLINSNELTGSEILELPKGREIVYYV